jgi:soluble lytic murein transglycosylase-like protein
VAVVDLQEHPMKCLVMLSAAALALATPALAQHPDFNSMVATHAEANGLPEALVHRVIKRESGYRPQLVGRGGTIGLMQIKLATARSLGYTGTAEGLRDPATNLTYAAKYLAGAFLAAKGDHNRAVAYYAGGYYYVQKRQRAEHRALAAAKPRSPATTTAAAATPAAVATPATATEPGSTP